jgi:predicted NBD/HSP70 family sugar kinase
MHFYDNDYQRNANISCIFDMIWRGCGSRIDIARRLGLYRSTVSNIIGTLLENGVLRESEYEEELTRSGRKPVSLSINPGFGCIVGIEYQVDHYAAVACTFSGDVFFSMHGETPADPALAEKPEESFLFSLDSIMNRLVPELEKLRCPPLGICVGIPGIINIDTGTVIKSYPFRLSGFDFGEKLKTRYGVPLIIENDAKCCAWLQCKKYRSEPVRDFITVFTRNYKDSIGVGLADAMGGRVLYGHNYAFGEFVSKSWRPGRKGQNGLPDAVMSTVQTNNDSYCDFIEDLFATLATAVPMLAPNTVFLYGQPESRHEVIRNVIKERVPQFTSVLEDSGATLTLLPAQEYELAEGAASMFLQQLFSVTETGEKDSYSHITWDEIFRMKKESSEHYLIHALGNQ